MGVLPEKILLATDGSEDAERATMAALDLAGRSGAGLRVEHRNGVGKRGLRRDLAGGLAVVVEHDGRGSRSALD